MKNLSLRTLSLVTVVSLVLVVIMVTAPTLTAVRAAPQLLQTGDSGVYTINVNGRGVANATPDIVDIQLGIETINANAQQALTQNTTQMTALMNAVKQLGVADKDIQTAVYNVWIEQVYDPTTGQSTGELRYHVVNLLAIRLRDVSKTGDLLQAAAQAGANNINSINFGVADTAALERQAREQAVADAKAKAEQLATSLGVKVGTVRTVAEYTSTPISESYGKRTAMDAAAGGGVPVASGNYNLTIEVQITFDIQR